MDVEQRFRKSDAELIDEIEAIRIDSNRLWMDILRTALDSQPETTRALLAQIAVNDAQVRELMKQVAP